jgi:hypothetical protein
MYAAIFRHQGGGPVDAVEKALLGTLIMAPYLRLGSCVLSLLPSHFSDPDNAAIFRSVMKLRRPEPVLVMADLDAGGAPVGTTGGWATLLGEAMGEALVDDEAVEDAAKAIKEDHVRRARETRMRRLG